MSVDYSVTEVRQSTDHSCWAAAAAMLLNYNGGNYDDLAVIAEVQERMPDYVWDQSSTSIELGQVAYVFRFSQIFPSGFTPEKWDDLLKSNGPLLIGAPSDPHRAFMVTGINIVDGEDASATPARIHVIDPQNDDAWIAYDSFVHDYETARSDFSNNIYHY